jgi:hypothetical protein
MRSGLFEISSVVKKEVHGGLGSKVISVGNRRRKISESHLRKKADKSCESKNKKNAEVKQNPD